MIMEVIKRKNALEIPISGKLDMQSARLFEQDFMEKYLGGSHEVIGLNMANLKFLDSSGLSILMKITSEANKREKKVYYISLSSTILSVIKIARLDNLLHFISEEEFNRNYPVID
jgi:anti-anti-sigma factor